MDNNNIEIRMDIFAFIKHLPQSVLEIRLLAGIPHKTCFL